MGRERERIGRERERIERERERDGETDRWRRGASECAPADQSIDYREMDLRSSWRTVGQMEA